MQVRLGPLAPSITDQGFKDSDGHYQKDAEAIARLSVRGVITQSERSKAERRLIKNLKPKS